MNQDYRFGIEEEFFLADAKTGVSPQGGVIDRFHEAASKAIDPASHELLKGQVEVATKPGTDASEARASLHAMRVGLSRVADDHGLALFAAGSQPLGRVTHQDTTEKERYERLKAEFGIIANRSMVCAMHIHVEVPDPDNRVLLMNRLLPYLPVFLALSSSSPFWQGSDSGLHSFRLAAFSEWPRMGLPEVFAGERDYKRFVDLLVGTKVIKDASFIWWLIRPSTHYPTIEMRICDSTDRVDDAVAIASLYRCLVRAVARRPDLNAAVGPVERAVCAENIWQAQRKGTGASFVDAATSACVSVQDSLKAMLDLVAEDAEALGCTDWVKKTRDIATNGSSADRQLAAFQKARRSEASDEIALRSVIAMLAETTAA